MKKGAKTGLVIIAVLYAVTVGTMVANFVMEAEPLYPEGVVEDIQQSLNEVRERAHATDPEHIRETELSDKEVRPLLDMLIRKGSIININYTLIMQCLNFGILLMILYGFLWDPLLSFLDKRRQTVRARLEEAAESRDRAQELVKQRQQELADLRAERGDIIEKARATAEQQREDIVERAQREATLTEQQTRERLQEEFRRARLALREEVADISTQVAARLLEREIRPDDHQRIIEDMVEEMDLESEEQE
ncbi:MAG: F0F1 ATP synthase subunit B [Candidatus Brocadiia bacterium]